MKHVKNIRAALWQAAAFGLVGLCVLLLLKTTSENLSAKGIASGFGFLDAVARVPVANASLPFESGVDTYGRALLIGVVNTLKVSLAAIFLATVIGVVVGSGRLSRNPLVRTVCTCYVEAMRNVPVLLHIFLWYQLLINLPSPTDAFSPFGMMVLSNRGLFFPALDNGAAAWSSAGLALLILATRFGFRIWPAASAKSWKHWRWVWLLVALPWVVAEKLPSIEFPVPDGFDVAGGMSMSPEYAALLIAIATYTAAFIAEIVRGAILSVSKGQWEAGASIGLSRGQVFRRVILPQAARVAMPSATGEYLGVLKNSSLAIAIGYQDVVAIGNSVLFETGQAIEVVGATMAFYVAVSLAISLIMELVGKRVALVER